MQCRPDVSGAVISSALSTALEVNDESLSYANLGSRVDWLARDLRRHGIGCGDIVALCLGTTENLVIAMLGVLKAGAAYLPLNPGDPAYRLGKVISHAASQFVVTDSQSMKNVAVTGVVGPGNQKRLFAFFVAEPNLNWEGNRSTAILVL